VTASDDRDPDDRVVVERARDGEREALDALLRQHHDRLWALCRRMTGDPADADDALQEALIAIARGIRRFDGRSAFGTWAYRVTTNACLDELRRRRRRPDPVEVDGSDPTARLPEPTAGIEGVAGRLDVDAALARLPHDFRTVVVLRDLCDLDYARIAAVLDLPPGTVRSRIARGRAQLADLLGNPPAVADRPTSGS
jgi:RNA polymerase sigma-70 factor, ECF subfamily